MPMTASVQKVAGDRSADNTKLGLVNPVNAKDRDFNLKWNAT